MIKNYYQILGLEKKASADDVKKAYRLYAQKFHPDKHKGDKFFEDKFKEVKEAYETLIDTNKRAIYDKKLFGSESQDFNYQDSKYSENKYSYNENVNNKKEYTPKPESKAEREKRELKEKRTKGCLIGIGTATIFFILLSLGDGWHVPIGIVFLFWTIRQAFIVIISFLKD